MSFAKSSVGHNKKKGRRNGNDLRMNQAHQSLIKSQNLIKTSMIIHMTSTLFHK